MVDVGLSITTEQYVHDLQSHIFARSFSPLESSAHSYFQGGRFEDQNPCVDKYLWLNQYTYRNGTE